MTRIQFSIRSILVVFALFAVGLVYLIPVLFPKPVPDLYIAGGYDSLSVGGWSYTTKHNAVLTSSTFQDIPTWFRKTPNPPISASDAMVIAQRYFEANLSGDQFPSELAIDSVELTPFDPELGHWYWTVSQHSLQIGGFVPSIDLAVLMDGSVVKPVATERTDLGWPLPDATIPNRPKRLTDQQIVKQFVDEINPQRTFAGQIVELVGRLSEIPDDHVHNSTGCRFHLILDDGTVLIFKSPGGWPMKFDVDLDVRAQLIGLRAYDERASSWDGLNLYPGVRVKRIGKHQ